MRFMPSWIPVKGIQRSSWDSSHKKYVTNILLNAKYLTYICILLWCIWCIFAYSNYLYICIQSYMIFDSRKCILMEKQPWNWRCGFNVVKCSDKFSLTHEWILMSFLIVLWRFLCAHRIILELCMGLYKTEI